MYWFVIGSYLLYVIFKMYANILEIAHVNAKKEEKAVILSPENYLKAAAYKIASQKFSIVSSLYDALLFILWVSFGLTWLESLVMFESVTLSSVVFMLSFIAINFLLSLPFDLYQTFALDKAFGFSTIDAKTYCIDLLKSTLLFVLFGGAFFAIMSLIIEQFSAWWVYGFGFAFAVILFINMI